jgi:hypothetical protein
MVSFARLASLREKTPDDLYVGLQGQETSSLLEPDTLAKFMDTRPGKPSLRLVKSTAALRQCGSGVRLMLTNNLTVIISRSIIYGRPLPASPDVIAL